MSSFQRKKLITAVFLAKRMKMMIVIKKKKNWQIT